MALPEAGTAGARQSTPVPPLPNFGKLLLVPPVPGPCQRLAHAGSLDAQNPTGPGRHLRLALRHNRSEHRNDRLKSAKARAPEWNSLEAWLSDQDVERIRNPLYLQ